jgi:hypothetical protein
MKICKEKEEADARLELTNLRHVSNDVSMA